MYIELNIVQYEWIITINKNAIFLYTRRPSFGLQAINIRFCFCFLITLLEVGVLEQFVSEELLSCKLLDVFVIYNTI